MPGKLLVFEGVEGCGKSTQLQILHAALLKHDSLQQLQRRSLISQVLATREPGGTELGLGLRQLLLGDRGGASMASRAELLLYAADRAQHVEEVIKPALAEGCWVLCDRFIDSTVAYQGYGRGLDLGLIDQLNQVATGGLVPDLTLWLRLDAEVGLARTRQRGAADRMEQANLAFHQRVQGGFEALAQQHPDRVVAIDAVGSVEAVAAEIFAVVEGYLQQWYAPSLTA
ncbi:dTMP kinase [Nodosilinea sp. LEGE 06152]|uniref:dTMP kinase n=1 Tax=Nodosilinea sp. LEGE 06152 TaxID=2777966 RepID=UPI00187FB3B2|nr:dTMP kinase [Nodosilinea sp. LEGE 06152]MBE9156665.1 dTMP kinase [Nodosilinea sp. LEGE 06152]MBE9160512.1 dTMP kinase [Nodosilinea sp. LEGE 06152]